MKALRLNDALAISARLSVPAVGAWFADVALELPTSGVIPSGRAVLTVGDVSLSGTIDPRLTGKKGFVMTLRLVGGAGGWDKLVPAVHLHNDAGVTSTTVYTVTAGAVGETVVDGSPGSLGVDYVRSAGPASRVLAGVKWYVDAAGVTRIGSRPTATLDSESRVADWDPTSRRATIVGTALVWPGTTLTSTLFGTAVVHDVEQTFSADGATATVWCDTGSATGAETPGGRLARALGAAARESTGLPFLKKYLYRVVLQGADGRLTLQSPARGSSVPDLLQSVEIWGNPPGVTQTLVPGSMVLVGFVAGDPALPVVVGFDPSSPAPLLTTIAATAVRIGAGTHPALMAGTEFAAWVVSVSTALSLTSPTDMVSTKLFTE